MYHPTIVMILVETQRSMVDICEISSSNANRLAGLVVSDPEARAATSTHPSLAVGPINSTVNHEAESPPCRALQGDSDVQVGRDLEKAVLEVNTKESPVGTTSDWCWQPSDSALDAYVFPCSYLPFSLPITRTPRWTCLMPLLFLFTYIRLLTYIAPQTCSIEPLRVFVKVSYSPSFGVYVENDFSDRTKPY